MVMAIPTKQTNTKLVYKLNQIYSYSQKLSYNVLFLIFISGVWLAAFRHENTSWFCWGFKLEEASDSALSSWHLDLWYMKNRLQYDNFWPWLYFVAETIKCNFVMALLRTKL